MKAAFRQIIVTYLAACLVLAGVAGVSPSLHVLLEHGGTGAGHVHGRKAQTYPSSPSSVAQRSEQRPGQSSHSHAHVLPGAVKTTLFAHSSAVFPSLDELAARFWHRLHLWLEHEPAAPASRDTVPEHHHDSLASLLAEGLIEQATPAGLAVEPPSYTSLRFPSSVSRVAIPHWDSQFSPRGPPVFFA